MNAYQSDIQINVNTTQNQFARPIFHIHPGQLKY